MFKFKCLYWLHILDSDKVRKKKKKLTTERKKCDPIKERLTWGEKDM